MSNLNYIGIHAFDHKGALKDALKSVLSDKGLVLYITRNKEVHGIITVEYTQVDAAEYGLEQVAGFVIGLLIEFATDGTFFGSSYVLPLLGMMIGMIIGIFMRNGSFISK